MPLLLQNGRFDEFVPSYEAEELHAAAPPSREVRWYDAGHNLTQQAVVDRLEWLRAQIGLDAAAGS
jgi:predicted esterase